MSELKKLIIFLSQFDLSSQKIKQIVDYLGEDASLKAFRKAKLDQAKILKTENYQKMLSMSDEEFVNTYVINLAQRGIKIICVGDDDYPQKLANLDDKPYILYYMGDLSLANMPSLAVVGSRKPTNYGIIVTERLVRDVASAGVVIVSGLAYGVDSIGHRKALEVGGKTIAVLGGGFDHIYPSEHQGLAEEIAEKGLLLSEYRPKMKATKYSFPTRNRIIAGLSDGVLITEASLKSGTIHTRDFALDYNRELFAVPGNIDSESSALTNETLKCGQGKLVTCANDILENESYIDVKKIKIDRKEVATSALKKEEQEIISLLSDGMKSVDELTKKSTLSINILTTYLTTLELSGIIRRLPGGYFTLN